MPKNLLLPSAKSGVLLGLPPKRISPWWRRATIAVGVFAVVVGAADALTRVAATLPLGDDILFTAFAPAATLFVPASQMGGEAVAAEALMPARLLVPAIGVDARVEEVGKTAEGAMATPKALANVGWYKLGSQPGEPGNAVFAGHVNSALGLAGVFKDLSKVKTGDTVVVEDKNGKELTYIVEEKKIYIDGTAPLDELFTSAGPSKMLLITCEGEWDEETRTFDKRLVVVARLQTP